MNREAKHLSPEVLIHFDLKRDPFDVMAIEGKKDVFMGGQFRPVYNALLDAVTRRGRCTALIAPRGSGKTTLLDYLHTTLQERAAAKSEDRVRIVEVESVEKARIPASAVYHSIIFDLSYDSSPSIPLKLEHVARKAKALLKARVENGQPVVILIDDAHKLNAHTLGYLKTFLEIRDGFLRYLSILLIGQQPLYTKIVENDMLKDLKVRTQFIFLHPANTDDDFSTPVDPELTPEFAKDYLSHKFGVVGAKAAALIADDAYPLLAHQCWTCKDLDNKTAAALFYAYEKGQKQITAQLVEKL